MKATVAKTPQRLPNRIRDWEKVVVLSLPILFLVGFMVAPLFSIFVYSFYSLDSITGMMVQDFTLSNYMRFFQQPVFLGSLGRTVEITLAFSSISLVLSYPVAYFIAIKASPRWQLVLLFLVVLPSWTSFLIRNFSWMAVLRTNGFLDTILMDMGVIAEPASLLYTRPAVIIGLLHSYMPIMILGIYAGLRTLDMSLLEAARDLGATAARAFLRVTLPLSFPGIATGILLGGVPVLGSFLTPQILGGPGDLLIGNLIEIQFKEAFNWPLGAAMASVVTIVLLTGVFIFNRYVGLAGLSRSNELRRT